MFFVPIVFFGGSRSRVPGKHDNINLHTMFDEFRDIPRIAGPAHLFWTCLMHLWPDWRAALLIVQPETVIRWHRQGFRLYWRWPSRGKVIAIPRVGGLRHRYTRAA